MPVVIGQLVPSFTIATEKNPLLTLNFYKGKNLILYFYPKDDTPGCTIESCGFRDAYSQIKLYNGEILGISKDSLTSHKKFQFKYNLPFELGSDVDGTVCNLYDVLKEKALYGKKYIGIERSTFLIDGNGILRQVWRNVKVAGHIEEVLQALSSLHQS